ncbi:MAG: TetR/AcrR family transcriptional regulator [Aquihabitans sp.]
MATQGQRRAATRDRLIDAATDVLVSAGAAGFTTTEVGKRAGLSQGAIFKHFATKADLLTATVEGIFAGLVVTYEGEFVARTQPAVVPAGHLADAASSTQAERLSTGLDLLWEIFQDERLLAAYDLFAAARTDPALQADLQPVVRAHVANLHALADLLFPEAHGIDPARLHDAVDLAAAAMQGLVINRLAVADPDVEERVRVLLQRWVGDRLTDLLADAGHAGDDGAHDRVAPASGASSRHEVTR